MFYGTDAASPELSLCSPYGPWTQGHGPTKQLGLALLECAAHRLGPWRRPRCLARTTGLAAAAGDGPRKRLAAAMVDCLARRLLRPVPAITDALIDPSGYLDRRSAARRGFFELSPFPKVAFVVGNRAIVEAVENESLVHVVGMSGPFTQTCQWIQLLHELRRRAEGPSRAVRLTVVHDDGEFLAKMAELVSDEAEELVMEFKFHVVVGQLEDLNFSNLHGVLGIKSGEALAVSCTLQLHRLLAAADDAYSSRSAHLNQMAIIAQLQHMAASSCPPSSCGASVQCKDDDDSYRSPGTPLAFVSPPASTPHFQTPAPLASFLFAVRALSPKIVVVAEQDADHNGVSFRKRFCEALHHYAAVFDSLDAAAVTALAASHLWPPDERAQVERVVTKATGCGVLGGFAPGPRLSCRGYHPSRSSTQGAGTFPLPESGSGFRDVLVVHIVDLSCSAAHPWQWLKLLDDFHGWPGGAPELYLTVLHDDNEFLADMQSLLSKKAESLQVSFHFISVIGRLDTLDFSNLRSTFQIKFGVAVAISCALQMHCLLLVDDNLSSTSIAQLQKMANFTQPKQMASSVCSPASTLNYLQTPSPRTPKLLARLLSAIQALKPNIMVIMEQDADHNTLLFCDRFNEVLNYYAALFDCFHAVAAANPRRTDERLRVERMILREEIKNILVCEGVHRHERHEKLDQWAMYMEESGFHNVQLSFSAIREGKENLLSFGLKNCQNKEDRGCLLLSWGSTNLYSISAWRQNRGSSSGSREHIVISYPKFMRLIKRLRNSYGYQLRLCCTNRGMFQDDMLSSAMSSPASSVYSPSPSPSNGSWVQELSHDQQSVRLIGLLYQCAAEVATGAFDPPHALKRLAAVFADALARKLLNLIPGLSRALLSSASSADAHLVPVARRHMFDVLPFLKLAYLTTNHAILEAMEGERFVHVVDFSGPAANPVQWIALFHAFRGRRGARRQRRASASLPPRRRRREEARRRRLPHPGLDHRALQPEKLRRAARAGAEHAAAAEPRRVRGAVAVTPLTSSSNGGAPDVDAEAGELPVGGEVAIYPRRSW
uniref:Uncharacterized protein n=1 Tax=Oryza punctata TaxID=4537 RepID=A0A0E0MCB3_ORYPU